jgi:hypothetical protein
MSKKPPVVPRVIFTDGDIEQVAASLPESVEPAKRALLAKILRKWAKTDIKNYLSHDTPPAIRARCERLKKSAASARDLHQAVKTLDEHDLYEIAFELARRPRQSRLSVEDRNVERQLKRLETSRMFLARFANIASRESRRGRGQPFNLVAYLIMRDCAALFEWLTGKRASHTIEGPFWRFVAAVWPSIFLNGEYGLSSAMKNWADLRRENPTWGVIRVPMNKYTST